MNVVTKDPIIFDDVKLKTPDMYSNVSGVISSEVKNFQDYLDQRGIKFVGATNTKRDNGKPLNKGKGYGNFGPSTRAAYAVYGKTWEGLLPKSPSSLKAAFDNKKEESIVTKTETTTTPTATSETSVSSEISSETSTEKKGFVSKFKAMSTTKKALIIGGVVVGLTLIVVIVKKMRK